MPMIIAIQNKNLLPAMLSVQTAGNPPASLAGWTPYISIAAPIVSALIPLLSSYLTERRAKRDWNGILRAIDVYMRWAEIGDVKTILLLRTFINKSIERIARPARGIVLLIVGVIGLTIDIYIIWDRFTHGIPIQAIPALLSLLVIVYSLSKLPRFFLEYDKYIDDLDVTYDNLVEKAVAHLSGIVGYDSLIESLVEDMQRDARVADLFSEGDPFTRRLYRSALDRARGTKSQDSDGPKPADSNTE